MAKYIYVTRLCPTGPSMTYYTIYDLDRFKRLLNSLKDVVTVDVRSLPFKEMPLEELKEFLKKIEEIGFLKTEDYLYSFVDVSAETEDYLLNKKCVTRVSVAYTQLCPMFKLNVTKDGHQIPVGITNNSLTFPYFLKNVKIPSCLEHCVKSFLEENLQAKNQIVKVFQDDTLRIEASVVMYKQGYYDS